MNRYRNAPTVRGPTKATASTLCQKCLKRDIYECKATAQERPYKSRPSRTQQLLNPKLRPQLSNDAPNELLRTQGVADDVLAKREEERGRQRDVGESDPFDRRRSPKRTRSVSSHSASSVSTISTNQSRSPSPDRRERYSGKGRDGRDDSLSPRHSKPRKRRYSDSASEHSAKSYSSGGASRSRSREWTRERNTRRRRRESSPDERGRARDVSEGSRRDRSRSRSIDRRRLPKSKRSISQEIVDDRARRGGRSPRTNMDQSDNWARVGRGHGPPPPPRERSLSPYSKRLALTQAMNIGR